MAFYPTDDYWTDLLHRVASKPGFNQAHDIDILRLCLTTPGALTPVIVGPPGIGKSQRVKKLGAELFGDGMTEVLSPGERGEGAFGVVPVPNGDGYLHYPAPDWVKRFAESGRGLVFVDEINTAPPALQPALLGLILDGRIGGCQLPARRWRTGLSAARYCG